ncbi:MAG: hypothetical protein WBX02_20580, partial [Terriglobales bacterium]
DGSGEIAGVIIWSGFSVAQRPFLPGTNSLINRSDLLLKVALSYAAAATLLALSDLDQKRFSL